VHLVCPVVNLPLRVDIMMEMTVRLSAVSEFDATDLYNPVTLFDLKAGSFSIEYRV